MVEVIPNVISSDLGETIESLLFAHVEGNTLVANTKYPLLRTLMHEAVDQFCTQLGLPPKQTISVFQKYESDGHRKVAHHVHADGGVTTTLGLSSDPNNNAGTVVLSGDTSSSLINQYNSTMFQLNSVGYTDAILSSDLDIQAGLVQAPRFGAAIIHASTLHTAPYLADGTARLMLLHASS